jgi:hypothetical protein
MVRRRIPPALACIAKPSADLAAVVLSFFILLGKKGW